MSELSVEVLKITKHPNEAAIKVRWRIKGIPLIRKAVPYIGRRIKVDADGYRSVFFLFMWLNVIYAKFELSQCWPAVSQGDHARLDLTQRLCRAYMYVFCLPAV